MFANCLGVIEAVARLGCRATVGEVQKMNNHLSRGQAQRIINQLLHDGYLDMTTEKHGRTGKKVYHVSTKCGTNMGIVYNALPFGVK